MRLFGAFVLLDACCRSPATAFFFAGVAFSVGAGLAAGLAAAGLAVTGLGAGSYSQLLAHDTVLEL